MINLRNALITGKRLPYDAEVEYLQSSGTQWIDTGTPIAYSYRIELTFATTASGTQYIFGDSISGSALYRWAQTSANKFAIMTGNGSAIGTPPSISTNTVYTARVENKVCYLNDVQFATIAGTDPSTPRTAHAYLFTWNAATISGGKLRLYSCKIYDEDGVLVRDYIPVRKGTTGELYDRVSGKFAERHGDFVVGQDVVSVKWLGNGASGSYILTNTHSGKDVSCNVKFAIVNPSLKPSTTQDCRLFPIRGQGVWNYNSYAMFFQCQSNQSDYGRMSFHGHNDAFSGVLATDSIFDINVSADGTDTVGITGTINGKSISSVSASISNITGNDYFRILENIAVPDTGSCGLRLLGCSLIKGGQEINKYLPVRVGTEGAMMDVLTRRIYRNAGTGAFTYGNDLKYPIPAS